MPTTDVTNTLIANISCTEQSSANVDINRSTGNPSFQCNTGQFTTYMLLATGSTSIARPITPTSQVYIRNLDSAAVLTVAWTLAASGGVVQPAVLNPGDQIILWQNPAGTTPGIQSLSLIITAATCLVEFFLGG